MSVLPVLFSETAREILTAIISIYAFAVIYKSCATLWFIIRLVRRMNWPNVTLKFVQHPKFLETFYDSDAFLPLLHDVTQKDDKSEHETSFTVFGPRVLLITYSADYAQALLTSPHSINKADMYSPLRETLGETLLTAPAKKWRAARKMFMPIFHKRMISTFMPSFNKYILTTTSELEKYVNKGEFVVESYVERCTIKATLDFLFGVPTYDDEIEKLAHLMNDLSKSIFTNMVRWWKVPSSVHIITPEGRANKKHMQEAEQLFSKVIRRRRDVLIGRNAEPEKNLEPPIEQDDATEKILIDILIDPERKNGGNTYSELALFSEATAHTSIHTVNSVLLMLAYHPEEQRKVYQELYDIYGSATPEDVPVVLSDHRRMHCMGRVIKETMRLFPPICFIARSVEKDIKIGDETIPKGCDACIFIYGMHRSEKYWPDPLKFDPDRFLPENSMDRPPWVYIPFSEGPRKCAGYVLAMATAIQFVATILRKYIISTESTTLIKDIKMKVKVISSFVEPVKIKIQKRQPIDSPKCTAGED